MNRRDQHFNINFKIHINHKINLKTPQKDQRY